LTKRKIVMMLVFVFVGKVNRYYSNVHSAAIRTYYFMLDSLPRFYQERTEDSERKESNEIQILNSYGT
jgi:hypothetical protein